MAELAVDLTEAYAKPLSLEVLGAADVVVTMGRSVGSVDVPKGTLHLDWRVGDPTGAPVEEVRRVRDDIDRASRSFSGRSTRKSPKPRRSSRPSSQGPGPPRPEKKVHIVSNRRVA
jgi:hypothetical protein